MLRVCRNGFIALTLLAVLMLSLAPLAVPQPAQAQGTIEDQIIALVARNLGITSYPTKGQLDRSSAEELAQYAFPIFYETRGLDLNDSGGVPRCNSRVLGEDELVIGWFGYRVIIRIQGLTYEFRTNGSGKSIIRCSGGQQVNLNFGGGTSLGRQITGSEATDRAMRHLSTYLGLSPVITRADVDAAYEEFQETGEFDYPYSVRYRWDAVLFTNSALNCPAAGQEFVNRPAAGYRMTITVDGRSYSYRSTPDGNILILCLGGRADPSSIGISVPSQ
jgi:hypothetical protein